MHALHVMATSSGAMPAALAIHMQVSCLGRSHDGRLSVHSKSSVLEKLTAFWKEEGKGPHKSLLPGCRIVKFWVSCLHACKLPLVGANLRIAALQTSSTASLARTPAARQQLVCCAHDVCNQAAALLL